MKSLTNLRRRPRKPPRFVGVVVSQRLIRPLAEIVRFLKPAEGGNLQGAPPVRSEGDATILAIFIALIIFPITIFNEGAYAQTELLNSTITVSPAITELVLDANLQANGSFLVFNHSSKDIPLKIYTKSFDLNEKLLNEDKRHIFDASLWIKPEKDSVIIRPNTHEEIKFQINAPTDSEPGGHYATIMVEEAKPDSILNPYSNVSRIGILTFITHPGEIIETASIESIDYRYIYFQKPFALNIDVKNTGNIHILPSLNLEIKNLFSLGKITNNLTIKQSIVMPQTIKRIELENNTHYFGLYKALLTGKFGNNMEDLNKKAFYFIIIPWKAFIVLIIFLTLTLAYLKLDITRLKTALKVLVNKK